MKTVTKRLARSLAETKLERAVLRILNAHAGGYDDGVSGFLKDLAYGGCASGLVGELVYTRDAAAFYRRHREEVGHMVA
jgi:hypothetical protein